MQVGFRLRDTVNLVYVKIHFQNTDSFVFKRTGIQQEPIRVRSDFGGSQQIWAVAVYDKPAGTTAYIDTLSLTVGNLAALQGFQAHPRTSEPIVGVPFFPHYQVEYNSNWVGLPENDNNLQVTTDAFGIVTYDATLHSFNAQAEGFSLAYVQYNGYRDTLSFNASLPLFYNCINKTIAGGSFKYPAIWSKGMVPGTCDSVIISTGNIVTIDTWLTCRAIRINTGCTLTINNATTAIQLGQADDGTNMLDNYGALNISNGTVTVQGRVKLNAAATFNMTGGKLSIDGNTGAQETAVTDGAFLVEAAAAMKSFSFTGGTLEIVDPPFGPTSQAISCHYNFGPNSILSLGNGISTTAGGSDHGFGRIIFPSIIGKLIINGTTKTGNRQFINIKTLTIKGSCDVRAGSGLVIQAPLNVTQ